LGKEVYSYRNIAELRKLTPVQNEGTSGKRIAEIGRHLLQMPLAERVKHGPKPWQRYGWNSPDAI
jgi:hypothetical protein